MKSKLVDPVHFFDSQGNSLMNSEFLHKRIKDLEARNEKLLGLVRVQALKAADDDHPEKFTVH